MWASTNNVTVVSNPRVSKLYASLACRIERAMLTKIVKSPVGLKGYLIRRPRARSKVG